MHVTLLLLPVSYLLGSIPTGYWVGLARGVDVRTIGSGNTGATNVFRALGRGFGFLCLAIDMAKGWIAAGVVATWSYSADCPWTLVDNQLLHGVTAILGHTYTCFLRFRGGKGVATSTGVLLAIVPAAVLISVTIWVAVVGFTHYVSLGSLMAANLLPVLVIVLYHARDGFFRLVLVCVVLALFLSYRHRANIGRLLRGEERKTHF